MLNPQSLVAIVLPLAAATLFAGPPAAAQVEERRTTVSYDDLDLSKRAGVARLSTRLASAIQRVCDVTVRPALHELSDQRACLAQAHAAAAPQVEQAVAAARASRFLVQADASPTPTR